MARRVYITILGLMAALSIGAQTPVQNMRGLTRAQIDSIVHPSVHPEGTQWILFEQTASELGTMSEDDAPVQRTFAFRNVSGRALKIARVRTTCGCTVAKYDTASVAPGATAKVTLTYNPKNRPGTIDVDAFVYLVGENKPAARLSLYGEVSDPDMWSHLPYAMGALRVKRRAVSFTELPAKGKPSLRILCANSGNKALKIHAKLLPDYVTLHTEPAVIAPGAEADLVITLDVAKLPANDATLRFPILLEGVSGRPSERTINVTIE